MLGTARAGAPDGDDSDLAVFVDRLAQAGTDRCTALARTHIRSTIAAGSAPPGLRRLAEALAASVTELPPPRRPVEDPVSLVEVMRWSALAVLDDAEPVAVAAAVGALVADGHRVIVTADDPDALGAVRDALPAELEGRSLDRIPALAPAALRELRRLLATSTPARRARREQELPPEGALPAAADVAQLCAAATREPAVALPEGTELVAALLAGLDPTRRAAVRGLAAAVVDAFAALPAGQAHPWAATSLVELAANSARRAVAEELLADADRAVAALEHDRSADSVEIIGRLPEGALDLLVRYLDFLDSGGRVRSYFRSPEQREVQPVLEMTTVGTRRPNTADDVRRLIAHLTIAAQLTRVDARCAELGLPAPRTEAELVALAGDLAAVVAAAAAVGAMRHDVLFMGPISALGVPDLGTAARVAAAVLAADDHAAIDSAAAALYRLADRLAGHDPAAVMAPEHRRALDALRGRDAAGYAAAVAGVGAARREIRDECRCHDLLCTLAAAAPRLATAWTGSACGSPGPVGSRPFGLAAFVSAERLLAALPPPDSADVVVVHGAGALGMHRLLLAAVAPRMVASAGPGRADGVPSMLDVLRRADAVVVRGRCRDAAAAPPGPRPRPTPAGQER